MAQKSDYSPPPRQRLSSSAIPMPMPTPTSPLSRLALARGGLEDQDEDEEDAQTSHRLWSRESTSASPSQHRTSPLFRRIHPTSMYAPDDGEANHPHDALPYRRPSQRFSISPAPNRLSLVGSYSESLLTGRMSTTPSRPFPFQVDLGVLGQVDGETPRHLLLDFDARYYALPEGPATTPTVTSQASYPRSFSSASTHMLSPPIPSPASNLSSAPYVGVIDIESHYHAQLACATKAMNNAVHDGGDHGSTLPPLPPAFPGYQVPAQGQIQLLIKNPHLNAPVKLFLVPYDLRDMPSATKTFVRQKIYVESDPPPGRTPATRKRHSIGAAPSAGAGLAPPPVKETLKYAVHLQFVALSDDDLRVKGSGSRRASHAEHTIPMAKVRYFLHKSVRVVFSPRPPDKEQTIKTYMETPAGCRAQGLAPPVLHAHKECLKKYMPIGGTSATSNALLIAGPHWYSMRKRVVYLRREVRRKRDDERKRKQHVDVDAQHASFDASQSDISLRSEGTADDMSGTPLVLRDLGDTSQSQSWYRERCSSGNSAERYAHAHAVDIPDAGLSRRDRSTDAECEEFVPNSDPNGERWAGSDVETTSPVTDVLTASLSRLDLSSAAPRQRAYSNLSASRPGTPVGAVAVRPPLLRHRSRTVTQPASESARSDGRPSPPLSTSSPLSSRPSSPFSLHAPLALTGTVKQSVNGTLHRSRRGHADTASASMSRSRMESERGADEQRPGSATSRRRTVPREHGAETLADTPGQ